jgi:hypothetical protein
LFSANHLPLTSPICVAQTYMLPGHLYYGCALYTMYSHSDTNTHIYIYIYIYIYLCIRICVYIYIYTYTHTHRRCEGCSVACHIFENCWIVQCQPLAHHISDLCCIWLPIVIRLDFHCRSSHPAYYHLRLILPGRCGLKMGAHNYGSVIASLLASGSPRLTTVARTPEIWANIKISHIFHMEFRITSCISTLRLSMLNS